MKSSAIGGNENLVWLIYAVIFRLLKKKHCRDKLEMYLFPESEYVASIPESIAKYLENMA